MSELDYAKESGSGEEDDAEVSNVVMEAAAEYVSRFYPDTARRALALAFLAGARWATTRLEKQFDETAKQVMEAMNR